MTVSISVAGSVSMTSSNTVTQSNQGSKGADGASTATTSSSVTSQLNAAIVQSSYDTALGSGNQSLSLLFKTALDSINEALKPTLGDNAIENAMSQDNSPEATAQRIVSMSTGFFSAYKSQHPNLSEQDALNQFMDTIKSGFERGYKDATGILQGLGVFNGDVASGVEKTHQLVLKGYDDFVAQQSKPADAGAAPAAA